MRGLTPSQSRRDRSLAANPAVGDTADAYLAQVTRTRDLNILSKMLECGQFLCFLKGEMELKRGCDSKRTLYYLTKAVQLNDYDESALVVRSRQQFSICLTLSLDIILSDAISRSVAMTRLSSMLRRLQGSILIIRRLKRPWP